MGRYIDADLSDEEIAQKVQEQTADGETFITVRRILHTFPTADVKPVIHARWILHIEGFPEYDDPCNEYECSNCGFYDCFSPNKKVNYCWNCGAEMDEGVEQ